MKNIPSQFYARTFLYWCGTLFLVPIACTGDVFVVLFLIWENVKTEDVIGLTIACVALTALAGTSLFQLIARQTPILKIYREGVQIRTIGAPQDFQVSPLIGCLLGTPLLLFLSIILVLWQCITLKAFRINTVRLPWESIEIQMWNPKTLAFNGWQEIEQNNDFDEELLVEHYSVTYHPASFGTSLKKVIAAFDYYFSDPENQQTLPSWEQKEEFFGNETFDFDE